MDKTLVSVIIPVYNAEKYLEQCVNSVLSQTHQKIELILVDDGSKDGSGSLCDNFAKKDGRVTTIHKENGGAASARNAGLDCAAGDYIVFLDSDDYWDDDAAIEKLLDYAIKASSDVVCFGSKSYYQRNGKTVEHVSKVNHGESSVIKMMQANQYISSSAMKMVSHEVIRKNNLRFACGQTGEDIEWSAKLLACADKISWYNGNFYVYRNHAASTTANVGLKSVKDVWSIVQKIVMLANEADDETESQLLHYAANEYVLLMTFSNRVKRREIKDILCEMKKYWWLVDNDMYPYVYKVRKLKFLGFGAMRKLLGAYRWLKQLKS